MCRNVEREPLLPLTGENIVPLSANRREDARADIRATGFWGRQQHAFFDVKVFAQTHRTTVTPAFQAYVGVMNKQRKERMGTE